MKRNKEKKPGLFTLSWADPKKKKEAELRIKNRLEILSPQFLEDSIKYWSFGGSGPLRRNIFIDFCITELSVVGDECRFCGTLSLSHRGHARVIYTAQKPSKLIFRFGTFGSYLKKDELEKECKSLMPYLVEKVREAFIKHKAKHRKTWIQKNPIRHIDKLYTDIGTMEKMCGGLIGLNRELAERIEKLEKIIARQEHKREHEEYLEKILPEMNADMKERIKGLEGYARSRIESNSPYHRQWENWLADGSYDGSYDAYYAELYRLDNS